jgi:hypothetical protein
MRRQTSTERHWSLVDRNDPPIRRLKPFDVLEASVALEKVVLERDPIALR